MKIPRKTSYTVAESLAMYFFMAVALGLAADIVTLLLQLPRPPVDYFSLSTFIFISGFLMWLSWERIWSWNHGKEKGKDSKEEMQ